MENPTIHYRRSLESFRCHTGVILMACGLPGSLDKANRREDAHSIILTLDQFAIFAPGRMALAAFSAAEVAPGFRRDQTNRRLGHDSLWIADVDVLRDPGRFLLADVRSKNAMELPLTSYRI